MKQILKLVQKIRKKCEIGLMNCEIDAYEEKENDLVNIEMVQKK